MSDFSNCTSSVLQPEICNFFPLSFPLWKKVIPSKIFFFSRGKNPSFFFFLFPTLPSRWDFCSHPSHSSILLFNRKCQWHLVPVGDCPWELIPTAGICTQNSIRLDAGKDPGMGVICVFKAPSSVWPGFSEITNNTAHISF